MCWIQTYSGVQFWPLKPRVEDVRLEDIAHALSLMCRFNGHCRKFYSVAQHSVLVAEDLLTRAILLDSGPERAKNAFRMALLHDASEAYLPDVTRPIKPSWPNFKSIEQRLLKCICEALDVSWEVAVAVTIKYCDEVLLTTERRDLMGPAPVSWEGLPPPRPKFIEPWSASTAEQAWLRSWKADDNWISKTIGR